MKFDTGKIVTSSALRKEFCAHFPTVLGNGYLEQQPRKGREHVKYKIKKALPTREEYAALRNEKFTVTVQDLISDGYGEAQTLAEEMQEAFDNMSESLQGGDVGQRREEAASTLSDLQEPDVPENCSKLPAVFLPATDTSSRAKRAAEAADHLNHAAVAIRDLFDNWEQGVGVDALVDGNQEALDLADQLENDAQTLGDVEFPGMYG